MNVFATAFFRDKNSAYESERCGEGRGVFFVNYLRSLVRAHYAVYPDFLLWIYHDDRAMEFKYFKVLERMQERGLLKLIYMGLSEALCKSMMWRLLPIWNLGVDIVLCRDLDALSTPRERRAIDKWIASGKAVSALHDSESHSSAALMGGMVSFQCQWMRNHFASWNDFVGKATQFDIDLSQHGADQRLLNALVLPLADSEEQIVSEHRSTLGAKDHYIDQLASHIGGCMHVDPCVAWFDKNPEYCPKLKEIRECELG